MKTTAWIGAVALAGLALAAGLRRSAPETPVPAIQARTPVVVAPAPAKAPEPIRQTADRLGIPPDEVEAFVSASRELVRELRRLQLQRQSKTICFTLAASFTGTMSPVTPQRS